MIYLFNCVKYFVSSTLLRHLVVLDGYLILFVILKTNEKWNLHFSILTLVPSILNLQHYIICILYYMYIIHITPTPQPSIKCWWHGSYLLWRRTQYGRGGYGPTDPPTHHFIQRAPTKLVQRTLGNPECQQGSLILGQVFTGTNFWSLTLRYIWLYFH